MVIITSVIESIDDLTSSMTFGSAPAFNKQFISSKLPRSAAMCIGVAPPAVILTFAPAWMQENI